MKLLGRTHRYQNGDAYSVLPQKKEKKYMCEERSRTNAQNMRSAYRNRESFSYLLSLKRGGCKVDKTSLIYVLFRLLLASPLLMHTKAKRIKSRMGK